MRRPDHSDNVFGKILYFFFGGNKKKKSARNKAIELENFNRIFVIFFCFCLDIFFFFMIWLVFIPILLTKFKKIQILINFYVFFIKKFR